MSEPIYVVETSGDFSDAALAAKLNDLYVRGYTALQVIENGRKHGYTVIGFRYRGHLV